MFRIGDKVQLKPHFWDGSAQPTYGWGELPRQQVGEVVEWTGQGYQVEVQMTPSQIYTLDARELQLAAPAGWFWAIRTTISSSGNRVVSWRGQARPTIEQARADAADNHHMNETCGLHRGGEYYIMQAFMKMEVE